MLHFITVSTPTDTWLYVNVSVRDTRCTFSAAACSLVSRDCARRRYFCMSAMSPNDWNSSTCLAKLSSSSMKRSRRSCNTQGQIQGQIQCLYRYYTPHNHLYHWSRLIHPSQNFVQFHSLTKRWPKWMELFTFAFYILFHFCQFKASMSIKELVMR